jgi:hypothetical protein
VKRVLSSPDERWDRDKVPRTSNSPEIFSTPKASREGGCHVSVLLATAMELSEKPPTEELNCEYLFKMIKKLELTVFKSGEEITGLKSQLVIKDTEVRDLQHQLQELDAKCSVVTTTGDEVPASLTADVEFIAHAKNPMTEEAADLATTVNRELPMMSDALASAEGHISELKGELKALKRKTHLESESAEQYTRRDSLKVRGVPYKQGEVTNTIICQIAFSLGVQISPSDISVSHRTGRRDGTGPRPILCKFVRRDIKHQLLNNKKRAAKITHDNDGNRVRIFLDEDLTAMRGRICKKMREENVPHYTRDGKVFIADPSRENLYNVFNTPTEWMNLEMTDSVKVELGIYPKD